MNSPITTSLAMESEIAASAVVEVDVTAGGTIFLSSWLMRAWGNLGWFMALEVNTDDNATGVIHYVEVDQMSNFDRRQTNHEEYAGCTQCQPSSRDNVPPPGPASPISEIQGTS